MLDNMRINIHILIVISFLSFSSCEDSSPHPAMLNPVAAALPPPPKWLLFPTPSADSPDLHCAGYSDKNWSVALDGENLKIDSDSALKHQPDLPPNVPNNLFGTNIGYHCVAKVDDGALFGKDFGEFGGGLWWCSLDGKTIKKLSDKNVRGFAKTSSGILAVVGLAHMASNYGEVLRVGNETEGNRKIDIIANLGTAPYVLVAEALESFLVLTTNELIRVNKNGTMEHLLKTKYEYLFPNSMTLGASGIIHIGMRHFVTRLTLSEKGYKEEWFVPADCARFILNDYSCICSPNKKLNEKITLLTSLPHPRNRPKSRHHQRWRSAWGCSVYD